MLFHEIYGCYYNAVAEILRQAVKGDLTEKEMLKIINDKAFSESFLTVIPSLKEEKWQLIKKDLSTPIKNEPSMPLTDLQKRWLKAISLDPRVNLFDADFTFLDGTEPLFTPEDYVVFDKYSDGDDFENKTYIKNFRVIFNAIKNRERLKVRYHASKGAFHVIECDPYKLEYSEKDDKFRVHVRSQYGAAMINLAGIERCTFVGKVKEEIKISAVNHEKSFVMELLDHRNALERVMLHFAHFKKEAEKIDEERYRVKIFYDGSDETELVIRVLSFGPFVEVTEPQNFRNLIIERLKKQKNIENTELRT